MDMSLNLDLINFHKPKDKAMFNDDTTQWGLFMHAWSKKTTQGEYAVIRRLDLSNHKLRRFPADRIIFVQCNLDNVSFNGTHFEFETAFINCSMKNVDFTATRAADALFLDCDLTGAKFDAKVGWSTLSLDYEVVPSFFSHCKLDPATEDFLLKDGCLTDKMRMTKDQQLDVTGRINDKLSRIITSSILDI